MRHRRSMVPGAALAIVFCLSLVVEQAVADQNRVGGYVAQAEDRFVRNVWNFVKHFNSWQSVGSHQYRRDQYYWMEPWVFDASHNQFIDSQHFGYVAAHGGPYVLASHNGVADVNFRTGPAYGDPPNGNLKFLTVQSCTTIVAHPHNAFDWNRWRHTSEGGIFDGLHQAMGYWTLSVSDNGVSGYFGALVKGNSVVWQAWFTAVQLERQFPHWNPNEPEAGVAYPGWASAIMPQKTRTDRLGSYSSTPTASDLLYSVWEQ